MSRRLISQFTISCYSNLCLCLFFKSFAFVFFRYRFCVVSVSFGQIRVLAEFLNEPRPREWYRAAVLRISPGVHAISFRNKIYFVFVGTGIEIRQNPVPHPVRTIILSITMLLFGCHRLHHYNALHNCIGLIAGEICCCCFVGPFIFYFQFM